MSEKAAQDWTLKYVEINGEKKLSTTEPRLAPGCPLEGFDYGFINYWKMGRERRLFLKGLFSQGGSATLHAMAEAEKAGEVNLRSNFPLPPIPGVKRQGFFRSPEEQAEYDRMFGL